jgi:hypothetical protein
MLKENEYIPTVSSALSGDYKSKDKHRVEPLLRTS